VLISRRILAAKDGPMKKFRTVCRVALLASLVTPCFAHHMAVVVNKDNNVQNLTSAQLSKIFKLETKKWPNGADVVLVLHKSSDDEISTLERLTKMTPAEVRSFKDSHKDSIRVVNADADVIDIVTVTRGAVGFIYERSINDRVSVVRVDGKLPLEAGYLPH
jgi:ABC-type phosphate transport system substrate-binding protein